MPKRKPRAKPIEIELIETEEINDNFDIIINALARWILQDLEEEFSRANNVKCVDKINIEKAA